MGLESGQKWTIRDLLYGLMLPSGNDAAVTIAEYLAGSEKAFAKQMNAKAQEIGMTHSYFTKVHGKDDSGKNYSTARDMAVLTAWALHVLCIMHCALVVFPSSVRVVLPVLVASL